LKRVDAARQTMRRGNLTDEAITALVVDNRDWSMAVEYTQVVVDHLFIRGTVWVASACNEAIYKIVRRRVIERPRHPYIVYEFYISAAARRVAVTRIRVQTSGRHSTLPLSARKAHRVRNGCAVL